MSQTNKIIAAILVGAGVIAGAIWWKKEPEPVYGRPAWLNREPEQTKSYTIIGGKDPQYVIPNR